MRKINSIAGATHQLWLVISLCVAWPLVAQDAGDSSVRVPTQLGLVDAVRIAVKTHPQLEIREIRDDIAADTVMVARGQFDSHIRAAAGESIDVLPERLREQQRSAGASDGDINTFAYETSVRKQLRSGLSIATGIEVSRVDQASDRIAPANAGDFNFVINQPLWRGRGRQVTTADEAAAIFGHEESLLESRHVAASIIRNAVTSYWRYFAALESLKILQASEQRAKKILTDTLELIDKDEVPSAERFQLEALHSQKAGLRIRAEQEAVTAGQLLILALGLSSATVSEMPAPSDRFPVTPDVSRLPAAPDIATFIDAGRMYRDDYKAARKREDITEIQMIAAEDGIKRRLDFSLDIGYDNFNLGHGLDRNLDSLNPHESGFNAGAFFILDWPVRNDAAVGNFRRHQSFYQLARVSTFDLGRTIEASITVTVNALHNSALEVGKTEEAGRLFQRTLENERQKLHLGMATYIDLISYEDRLTDVQLRAVAAKLRYFEAVVRLSFEAGLLLPGNDNVMVSIDFNRLVEVPDTEHVGGDIR